MKSFASFFNRNPVQTRNDTTVTFPPTASSTPKPPSTTTETVLYIPIIQETVYEPDYYPLPPHPIFYNVPPDGSFQWDDLGAFPGVRNLPPLIVPSGIESLPLFNVPQINTVPDKINYPAVSEIKPTLKPSSGIAQGVYIDPDITEADRDALAMELMKMIGNYFDKKQQKLLAEYYPEKIHHTDTNHENDYKIMKQPNRVPVVVPPNSLFVPAKVDKVFKPSNKTVNESTLVAGQNEINKTLGNQLVSNSTNDYDTERMETTQITLDTNQWKGTEGLDTDDSRKLDFHTNDEDESLDVTSTTDPLDNFSSVFPKGLRKLFTHNKTSNNGSEINDRFKGDVTEEPKIRHFVDERGNNCTKEVVRISGKIYDLISCVEKSFNGELEVNKKVTYESDVTYFTEELTTEPTPPVSETVIDAEQGTESRMKIDDYDLPSSSETFDKTTNVYDSD